MEREKTVVYKKRRWWEKVTKSKIGGMGRKVGLQERRETSQEESKRRVRGSELQAEKMKERYGGSWAKERKEDTHAHTHSYTHTVTRTYSHTQPYTQIHSHTHVVTYSHTPSHTKDRQERSWKTVGPLLLRPPMTPRSPQSCSLASSGPVTTGCPLRLRCARPKEREVVVSSRGRGPWRPAPETQIKKSARARHAALAAEPTHSSLPPLPCPRGRPQPFLPCPAPRVALTPSSPALPQPHPFQVSALNHTSGLSASGFVSGEPGQRHSPLSFNYF